MNLRKKEKVNYFKNVDERYNIPPSTNDDGKELGRQSINAH